eukprot:g1220.t1
MDVADNDEESMTRRRLEHIRMFNALRSKFSRKVKSLIKEADKKLNMFDGQDTFTVEFIKDSIQAKSAALLYEYTYSAALRTAKAKSDGGAIRARDLDVQLPWKICGGTLNALKFKALRYLKISSETHTYMQLANAEDGERPCIEEERAGPSESVESCQFEQASLLVVALRCVAGAVVLFVLPLLCFNASRLRKNQVLDTVPMLTNMDRSSAEVKRSARLLAKRLSRCIQFKTVSYDKFDTANATDYQEFEKLIAFLRETFPLVHKHLKPERHGLKKEKCSLLFQWTGTDKALKPAIVMAHLDVVPCPNAKKWKRPPFDGDIDSEGVVWGRGAIDNKHSVISILSALEDMLSRNPEMRPRRTLYVAFGHDEEIGGSEGAAAIAAELRRRKVRAEFILDEGAMILKKALPGYPKDRGVAFICNCEKGAVNMKLEVSNVCPPGHSSQPSLGESNVSVLCRAVARLKSRPFPTYVDSYLETLKFVASELSFPMRVVAANTWLFKPLLRRIVLAKKSTAAMVRTTTAITVLNAGEKVNSIPGVATAFVNHRVHPMDVSKENVIAYDRRVINDPRVTITSFGFDGKPETWTPIAPMSSTASYGFDAIKKSVAATFGAPVTPMLMIGNTDTRHYWSFTSDIYRFSAIEIDIADVGMFHGIDERVSEWNLYRMMRFYKDLFERVLFSTS